MIIFACSGCQKKLAVKEDLAGKKVKCPGCGEAALIPSLVGTPLDEERTIAPTPEACSQDGQESPLDIGDFPTQPPVHKSDDTNALAVAQPGYDSSLTAFLTPAQADDELGRLGKYRVLEILGHGGMGVVFKAEDPMLKRRVAIKAMLPSLAASANSSQRFQREAQTMAALKHDHVVTIYDVGEDRGVPFLAMEFLHGEPLEERLKREPRLPLADVLRIGREIAEALCAAHATGLIHRDIKPANIWLEDRGVVNGDEGATYPTPHHPPIRVKILDFGLARAAKQESGLTLKGSIIGTPAYMAPEQARGTEVDARCDLFSLGVVLYRMCTGEVPFKGVDTMSTMMSIATHKPPPPVELNGELPQELSALVMRLLEKDPARRLASAREVVKALQRLETEPAGQATTASETEPVRQKAPTQDMPARRREWPKKPTSKRWWLIGALGVGCLSVVLVFLLLPVVAWIFLFREHPPDRNPIWMPIQPDLETLVKRLGGKVERLPNALMNVDLQNTQTSDADLLALNPWFGVRRLDLSFTKVTDKGILGLEAFSDLHDLRLVGTQVTDASLPRLLEMRLIQIDVAQTQVSEGAAAHLVAGKNITLCRVALGDKAQFRVLEEYSLGEPNHNSLMIGDTIFGRYFNGKKPDRRREATTYYHRHGPVGQVMNKLEWFKPTVGTTVLDYKSDVRMPASLVGLLAPSGPLPTSALAGLWSEPAIGVIRLNAGTHAAYGRPFQHIHFYNGSPELKKLSLPDDGQPAYFGFVQDAMKRGCWVKVAEGPERLSFSKQAPKKFYQALFVETARNDLRDVNTDLLTQEALAEMMDSLTETGVLCFHTSNRDYDLVRPIIDAASSLRLTWKLCDDESVGPAKNPHSSHFGSHWVMVARQAKDLQHLVSVQTPGRQLIWSTPASTGKHLWRDGQMNDLKSTRRVFVGK